MRTIIDIPEQDIKALDVMCGREHISRAEAIRRAVSAYLRRHGPEQHDAAFGIWKGRKQGGLSYQEAMRSEWDTPTVHEPTKP